MTAECIDRIDLFVKSLIVTLLCLTMVLGYSAGAQADQLPIKPNTIAAGINHSMFIAQDGTLWAWGYNGYGRLGTGGGSTSSPVQVGWSSDWVAIAAGRYHTLGIKSDGTLWAWGYNGSGQLGDGTTAERHSPVQVGESTDWVAVTAGGDHTLGLKTGGTLWAWGYNE